MTKGKRSDEAAQSQDDVWYYSDGQEQYGPFPREEIEEKVQQGDISKDDLVWTVGMDDWKVARDVFDFAPTPPPLAKEQKASAKTTEESKENGQETDDAKTSDSASAKASTANTDSPSNKGSFISKKGVVGTLGALLVWLLVGPWATPISDDDLSVRGETLRNLEYAVGGQPEIKFYWWTDPNMSYYNLAFTEWVVLGGAILLAGLILSLIVGSSGK